MKAFRILFYTLTIVAFVTATVLATRSLSAPVFAAQNALTIVIDAGHGGIDGGVSGVTSKKKESEINLSLSFKLKDKLSDLGFAVTLTRKTDAGLYDAATKGFKKRDMLKRKELIERASPALVISVHQNFYPTPSVRGGQAFYKKEDEKSKRLAVLLQERLNGFYDLHGVKPRSAAVGDYFVLNATNYPSVIVEFGFLSNPEDEALLLSERGKDALASAAAAGVLDYFAEQIA